MKKAFFLLAMLALPCMAQDTFDWQADSSKGFWAGLNLARNFDGQKVDRANGFLGKAWAIGSESVMSVCRSAADTGVYAWNHKLASSVVIIGSIFLASEDAQEAGQDLIDAIRGKDSDDGDATSYAELLKNQPNIFIETDGNGNKVFYEYPPEGGAPVVVLTVDGNGNEIHIGPSDWKPEAIFSLPRMNYYSFSKADAE